MERERESAIPTIPLIYLHLLYACIYVAHARTFVVAGALDIMHVAKGNWRGMADPARPES